MRSTSSLLLVLMLGVGCAVVAAEKGGEGAQCSQDNQRLDANTGNLVTDCDSTTWCTDAGICQKKGCRSNEYPLGYNDVPYAQLPPQCAAGFFCPDEGSSCQEEVELGGECQLDRDDQCHKPPAELKLGGPRNVDGAVCLNNKCYYANVTVGQTCVTENKGYVATAADGSTYGYVFSRDNCFNGYYCDGTSLLCIRQKQVGDECSGDKECHSFNCIDDRCRRPAGDPRHPAKWVYAVVSICIGGGVIGVMVGLWFWHKKTREHNRIKLEQYESEQTAYRQALLSLNNARQSIMALPKDTPEQVARQSIYSVDLYNQQPVSHAATGTGGYSTALSTEHSPPSSRRPSQIQSSWSADGHNQEEDVLIIPQKNRR